MKVRQEDLCRGSQSEHSRRPSAGPIHAPSTPSLLPLHQQLTSGGKLRLMKLQENCHIAGPRFEVT